MIASRLCRSASCVALASFALWTASAQTGVDKKNTPQPGGKPVDLPGLHNVIHVSDRLISGGSPEGDAGFESLKMLGIRTILSVDGARPDLVRAKKFGMRYVHLPIGYDGVSQEQALKLAKAVRDLSAPIYIHCHHGKHRSPGAAAAIQMCLDDKCTVAQAVDIMKRAGTDPRYAGLYTAPKELKRPTSEELSKVKVEFPEAAEIPAVAKAMVDIDHRWEHLTLIKKAGWKVPKDHPDLDPPHEALQLMEHYREMARLPSVQKRPADFKVWLKEGEDAAAALEAALRKATKQKDAKFHLVEKAFEQSRKACTQCHAKYRDVPRSKTAIDKDD
jgi:protein tyrosine phosphatase (PTP) superfamily phosphohydrolase (DUF442 family)